MSKTRRKILKRIVAWIFLPLLFLIVGVLLYVKMHGFQKALEELVYSRTDGQYSLVIKKSTVDVFDLNFTFQDVRIKTNSSSGKGSHTVTIPRIRINFGSVASMLALEKFKIDNLEIDEPLITVESVSRDQRRTSSTLPQQIVKLYPAVESLLSRFDIRSLSVKRATLSLVKPDNTVTIRLIDLLIKHWNILHLDKDSQLLLHVHQQLVDLGKVSLDFAQIEYDFKKRHLLFSGFTLATTDTVSTSHVMVTAKSLLLNKLDYKELYENQRYVLQRAVLDSPVVHARFALKEAKKNKWPTEKGILTRILKQTFGECMIDSAVIRNARLDLVLHKNNDSVKIDLPNVDFKLHSFSVTPEEETFQVGEIETNLNGTIISLKNDLSLRFNRIFFHNDRDVTITNATLLDSDRKAVATIGTMRIDDADILPFVFTKYFHAKRLLIDNAVINIPERKNRNTAQKKSADVKEIRVDNTSLKNVTLYYRDAAQRFSVKGVSAEAKHIRYDSNGVISYKTDRIKIDQALVDIPAQQLNVSVSNISVQDRILRFENALVRKDSLDITLRGLDGEAASEITAESYHTWKTLTVENVIVHGVLPAKRTIQQHSPSPRFLCDQLAIAHLNAAVTNAKNTASFSGDHVRIDALKFENESPAIDAVQGVFRNIDFHKPDLRIFVTSANVLYPGMVRLEKVNLVKDNIQVALQLFVSRAIKNEGDSWQLKQAAAHQVAVQRNHETFFESDSVRLNDIAIHEASAPVIGVVEIFHPVIQSPPNERAQRKTFDQAGLIIPDRWIVHPGEWRRPHHHPVFFGRWDIDEEKNSVRCAFIRTETEKMTIGLRSVTLIDQKITVDSVILRGKPEWIQHHPVEDDQINTSLYGITIVGVSRHALMHRKPLRMMDVSVRGFDLDVRRDKRLPDPPAARKPVILDEIVHLPPRMRVVAFHLAGGHIRYTETSDKTGEQGFVDLDNIAAEIKLDTVTSFLSMRASASPYGSGSVHVIYQTIDSGSFKLFVKASDIDLTKFNNVVVPFMPARILSGHLKEYDLDVTANADEAIGKATITYSKLHFQLVNKEMPDKKNFKTGLLTFIADDLVLRNKRNHATHEVYQVRLKDKSIFNYWVKSIVSGAVGAVRKGKRERPHVD